MRTAAPTAVLSLILFAVPALARHDGALAGELRRAAERDLVYHLAPDGGGEVFADEIFAGPFDAAVGLTFDAQERLWVWEKAGRVYFVDSAGAVAPEPLLDIGEEVGDWGGGNGMLGFAFAPDFALSGYVYLLYIVDHHHLAHFGTPEYDPELSEDYADTIGRLTRYQVFDPTLAPADLRIDPASRTILIGADASSGFPMCSHTHGVGTLLFGADGSLLASCGDGHLGLTGSGTCSSEGIIAAKEDVTAYRSQLVDSLSGKVLRIDPLTGSGLPSNPFYDPLAPDAPRSRVWFLGLRQPYRLSRVPGTGSASTPGTLFIGDVGGQTWEELNVASEAGTNFGWPVYEGLHPGSFANKAFANLDAPNPLFGQTIGGNLCEVEFFDFRDLLHDEALPGTFLDLPNPCDASLQVPEKHMHTRPILTWKHDEAVAFTKSFDAFGNPIAAPLGSEVAGSPFPGAAAIGGVWYSGDDFPAAYQDAYFLGDFVEGWIRCVRVDENYAPLEVLSLTEDAGSPVAFATHPSEGGLYYVDFTLTGDSFVRHITFLDNLPPVAKISVDAHFGPSPLTVQFSAADSFDPEGQALAYDWDFGDGSPHSTAPNPLHVYTTPTSAPASYVATLTVTDSFGVERSTSQLVSPNNSPPVAAILSPANGTPYASDAIETVDLASSVLDAEHGPGDVHCEWSVVLHHDEHTHPQPNDPDCLTSTVTGPHTLDGDTEYVSVRLTATDAHGLSHSVEHLMPRSDDCNLNGFPDDFDIAQGWSLDTDLDGVPDECSNDCDGNRLADPFELAAGLLQDCDNDGVPDSCEIALGAALDLDGDGVPDPCQELSVDVASISLGAGGSQTLTLAGGPWLPGDLYWVVGSMTGTAPGTPLGAVELPLVADFYFTFSLTTVNQPPFAQSFGFLDAGAGAQASVGFAPGSPPGLAGLTLYHAAFLVDSSLLDLGGIYDATNWMPLQLID